MQLIDESQLDIVDDNDSENKVININRLLITDFDLKRLISFLFADKEYVDSLLDLSNYVDLQTYQFQVDKIYHNINDLRTLINDNSTDQNNEIDKFKSDIKSYIDTNDFIPIPPKIGFTDGNNVPIYGTYNMNYHDANERCYFITTDNSGMEVMYFHGNSGKLNEPYKMFKGTRTSTNSNFIYGNNPVKPAYMENNDYISQCISLGNNHIVYKCYFNGSIKYHLIITNGNHDTDTWTTYKDITSLITGNISGVIYNDLYNTIAIVTASYKPIIKLYNLSDLSLITSQELVDIINYNELDSDITSIKMHDENNIDTIMWNGLGFSAEYISSLNKLVLYTTTYDYVSTDTMSEHAFVYTRVFTFSVPLLWFSNGLGNISILTPKSYYKVSKDGYYGKGVITEPIIEDNSPTGGFCMSYDSFEDVLRLQFSPWGCTYAYLIATNVSEQVDSLFGLNNTLEKTFLYSPDSSPWGKQVYHMFTIDNTLFLPCKSQKYGTSIISMNEYKKLDNRYISIKNGKWTKQNSLDYCLYTMCQRVNNTTTKWHVWNGNSNLYEVKVNSNHQIYSIKTSYILPEIDSIYNVKKAFAYDINNNIIYYLVNYKNSTDPQYQGYPFLLIYDVDKAEFKEFSDPSLYPTKWNEYFRAEFDILGDRGFGTSSYNMFIDLDGTVYFEIHFYASSENPNVTRLLCKTKYNKTTETLSTNLLRITNHGYNYFMAFSYDDTFGYIFNENNESAVNYAHIQSSKDIFNGGPEKTLDQFWSGDYYTTYIDCSSQEGLVAYIAECPIFLGGYYSILPTQEVQLYPNAVNYIYLSRNKYDRHKIDVVVKLNAITSNRNSFNRLLISKITTDSTKCIAQEDYTVND